MLDGRVPESWIPPEHILELRGACACDYVEPLGLAQSTLSLHLKVLYEAGLLEREKRDLGVLPASRSARERDDPRYPGLMASSGRFGAIVATTCPILGALTSRPSVANACAESRFCAFAWPTRKIWPLWYQRPSSSMPSATTLFGPPTPPSPTPSGDR